jgi:diaminopimelate decarboxylase
MKAAPTWGILQTLRKKGIKIDASSVFEVERAIASGYTHSDISLSSQELGAEFEDLVRKGVSLNACSLSQIRRFGEAFKNDDIASKPKLGIRVNPGVGSGGLSSSTTAFSKTNVGGPTSSFGIWVGDFESGEVKRIVEEHQLTVERIHTHIGSGSDPEVWKSVASKSLGFVKEFPTVKILNLGGGFKVGRAEGEKTTDLQEVGASVKQAFIDFQIATGRDIKLELEPGTFLMANAGALVARVQDVVTTSDYKFLKLDAGMTDVLRPSLYGSNHPLTIFPQSCKPEDVGTQSEDVVVVGHCCESGDLMTPGPSGPESLGTRSLRSSQIGDFCIIDGAGAYCSSMSTKNYNSFPEAGEVMLEGGGSSVVLRKRQEVKTIWANEVEYLA